MLFDFCVFNTCQNHKSTAPISIATPNQELVSGKMEDHKSSSSLASPNDFGLELLSDIDMEEWVTVSKESSHDPTDDNFYRPHQVDTLALQNQQGPRSSQAIQSTPSISLERRFGSSDEDPLHQGHQVMHRREYFLLFTRVLVKYLEKKDKELHTRAKKIIRECVERNKRQENGIESMTKTITHRLKELVGDHRWKKANEYLLHFLQEKESNRPAGTSVIEMTN